MEEKSKMAFDFVAAEQPANTKDSRSQYADITVTVNQNPFDAFSLLAEAPAANRASFDSSAGGTQQGSKVSRDLPNHTQAEIPREAMPALHNILQKPPHVLSDDDYFNGVLPLMTPGAAWSGDGRNHELSLKTETINGRRAIVYDYFRMKDATKDSFDAKPGPDDLRGKVVFFANETTGKVDIFWMQAPQKDFAKRSAEFDEMLKKVPLK